MHATLTSKGQVTLPKALREKLSLSAGDRVEFILDDDDQSLRLVAKHTPLSRLKGMLPQPQKAVTLDEMDQAIQAAGGKKP